MGMFQRVRRRAALLLASLLVLHTVAVSAASAAWQPRLTVDGRLGTMRSSASFQVMMPILQDEERVVFVDLRGVSSTDESVEGNLGAGYRWFSAGGNSIYGAYLFADRRRTASGNLWDQLTAGFEVIGVDTDYRLNVYIPRTERQLMSSVTDDKVIVSGTTLIYEDALLNTYETAMGGFDIGLSRRLPGIGGDARLGLRAYHFTAPDAPSVTGGNIRLETRYYDLLNLPGSQLVLGIEAQSDGVRGSQGFVTVGFSVPFGAGTVPSRSGQTALADRMMDPVQRDIDIVVQSTPPVREVQFQSDPLDIVSGEKVTGILFVSADGQTNAEGDPEDPLDVIGLNQRLAEAAGEGTDAVLIIPIGDEAIHTGDDSIVLQPGNILMSKGELVLQSSATGRSVPFLPGVNTAQLTNDDNPVVVVTANNRIVGIDSLGGTNAVFGEAATGRIMLERVDFTGTSDAVVNVSTAGDLELIILDSTLEGVGGVRVVAEDGATDVGVRIEGSTLNAAGASALLFTGQASGDVTFGLAGSTVTGAGSSFVVDAVPAGSFDVSISGSSVEVRTLLLATADGASASASVENSAFAIGTGGFSINLNAEGPVQVRVGDSEVAGAGQVYVGAFSPEAGATVDLTNVDVDVAAQLTVLAFGAGDAKVAVTGGDGETIRASGITVGAVAEDAASVTFTGETIRATAGRIAVAAQSAAGNVAIEIAGSDVEAATSVELRVVADAEDIEGAGNADIIVEDSRLAADTFVRLQVEAGADAGVSLATTGETGEVTTIEAPDVILSIAGKGAGVAIDGVSVAAENDFDGYIEGAGDVSVTLSGSEVVAGDELSLRIIGGEVSTVMTESAIDVGRDVLVNVAAETGGVIGLDRTAVSSAFGGVQFDVVSGDEAAIALQGAGIAAALSVMLAAQGEVGDASVTVLGSTVESADGNVLIVAASSDEGDVSIVVVEAALEAQSDVVVGGKAAEGNVQIAVANSQVTSAEGDTRFSADAGSFANLLIGTVSGAAEATGVTAGGDVRMELSAGEMAYLYVGTTLGEGEDGSTLTTLDAADDVTIRIDAGTMALTVFENIAVSAGDDIRAKVVGVQDADLWSLGSTLAAEGDLAVYAAAENVHIDLDGDTWAAGDDVKLIADAVNASTIDVYGGTAVSAGGDVKVRVDSQGAAHVNFETASVTAQDDIRIRGTAAAEFVVDVLESGLTAEDGGLSIVGKGGTAVFTFEDSAVEAQRDVLIAAQARDESASVSVESTEIASVWDDVTIAASSKMGDGKVTIVDSTVKAEDNLNIAAVSRSTEGRAGVAIVESELVAVDEDVNLAVFSKGDAEIVVETGFDAQEATSIEAGGDVRMTARARGDAAVYIHTLAYGYEEELALTSVSAGDDVKIDVDGGKNAVVVAELASMTAGDDVRIGVDAREGAEIAVVESALTASGGEVKVETAGANAGVVFWESDVRAQRDVTVAADGRNEAAIAVVFGTVTSDWDDVALTAESWKGGADVAVMNASVKGEDNVIVSAESRRSYAVLTILNSALTAVDEDVFLGARGNDLAVVTIHTVGAEPAATVSAGQDIVIGIRSRADVEFKIVTEVDPEAEDPSVTGLAAGDDIKASIKAGGNVLAEVASARLDAGDDITIDASAKDTVNFLVNRSLWAAGDDVELAAAAGPLGFVAFVGSEVTAGDDVRLSVRANEDAGLGAIASVITAGDDVRLAAESWRGTVGSGFEGSVVTAGDSITVTGASRRGDVTLVAMNSELYADAGDVRFKAQAGGAASVAIVTLEDSDHVTAVHAGRDIRIDVRAKENAAVTIGTYPSELFEELGAETLGSEEAEEDPLAVVPALTPTKLTAQDDVKINVFAGESAGLVIGNAAVTAGDDIRTRVRAWGDADIAAINSALIAENGELEIRGAGRNAVAGIVNSEVEAQHDVTITTSGRTDAGVAIASSTVTSVWDDVTIGAVAKKGDAALAIIGSAIEAEDTLRLSAAAFSKKSDAYIAIVDSQLEAIDEDVRINVYAGDDAKLTVRTSEDAENATTISAGDDIRVNVKAGDGATVIVAAEVAAEPAAEESGEEESAEESVEQLQTSLYAGDDVRVRVDADRNATVWFANSSVTAADGVKLAIDAGRNAALWAKANTITAETGDVKVGSAAGRHSAVTLWNNAIEAQAGVTIGSYARKDASVSILGGTVTAVTDDVTISAASKKGDARVWVAGADITAQDNLLLSAASWRRRGDATIVVKDANLTAVDHDVRLAAVGDDARMYVYTSEEAEQPTTITAGGDVWTTIRAKDDVRMYVLNTAIEAGGIGLGADIETRKGEVDLNWSGNTVTSGATGFVANVDAKRTDAKVVWEDNTIRSIGEGMVLDVSAEYKSVVKVGIFDNDVDSASETKLERGIVADIDVNDDGVIKVEARSNKVHVYNQMDDVAIGIDAYVGDDGMIDVVVEGNEVSAFWDGIAVRAEVYDAGEIFVGVYENRATAEWSPIDVVAKGARENWKWDGTIEVDLFGNQIVGNSGLLFSGSYGAEVHVEAADYGVIYVQNNNVVVIGGSGLSFNLFAGEDAGLFLGGNTVRASKNGAIALIDALTAEVVIGSGVIPSQRNSFWALDKGVSITAAGITDVDAYIYGNKFEEMQTAAIAVTAKDSATVWLEVEDNDFEHIEYGDGAVDVLPVELGAGEVIQI